MANSQHYGKIDRRMSNSMVYSEDITTFDQYIQRIRLYQFLTGIHEDLGKEKRDLLLTEPLLTVDKAYATIR